MTGGPSYLVSRAVVTATGTSVTKSLPDWMASVVSGGGGGSGGGYVYAADPAFGGTWDATHDVGPAINSAIASLTSGGTVVLPPGKFGQATAITLPNDGRKIRLWGAGREATTLKVLAASTLTSQILQNAPASAVWFQAAAHDIGHMTLDASLIAAHNIDLENGHGTHIHDLYGLDPAAGGSNIRFRPDGIPTHLAWENIVGHGSKFRCGPSPGAGGDYCIEANGTDCWFIGFVAHYAKIAACIDRGGNNKFRAVHVWGVPVGFTSSTTAPMDVENCVVDTPTTYGIEVRGDNSKIQNNRIFWPGSTSTGTEIGIRLVFPMDNALIVGNLISDIAGDKRIVSDLSPARVGVGTIITNNPGATLYTGGIPSNAVRTDGYFSPFIDLPDGTTPNGDTPGAAAIDLTQGRSQPSQIPAADASLIQGFGNSTGALAYGGWATGSGCAVTAPYSWARGVGASDKGTSAKRAYASGKFAAAGDAQRGEHELFGSTATTSPTQIGTGGTGLPTGFNNYIALNVSQACMIEAKLIGRRDSDGAWVTFVLDDCVADKGASFTSLALHGTTTFTAKSTSAGAPAVTAPTVVLNTAGSAFTLQVTPPDATTWHWFATVTTREIG